MTAFRLFFEFLPLALAVLTLAGLVVVYRYPRRKIDQMVIATAMLACWLLVLAQSNWIQSLFAGLDTGSPFVEYVWTAFNTTVMSTYLLLVWSHLPRRQ